MTHSHPSLCMETQKGFVYMCLQFDSETILALWTLQDITSDKDQNINLLKMIKSSFCF